VRSTDCLKSILGGEFLLAKIATIAVVIHGQHVLVGINLGHKHPGAHFAGDGPDRIQADWIHVEVWIYAAV
jgi:hypothetical protein